MATSALKDADLREQRRQLLRAWTAMERFGTTTLGRTARTDRLIAIDVEPDQPLPWEPGHPAFGRRPISDKVEWRHTLHIGQFEIGAAYEAVEARFPEAEADEESERRRPRGMAPLLALTLTTDGRPLVDSLQVSSAAWSIARTLKVGVDDPKWLSGFEETADQVSTALARLMTELADRAALADGYAIPEHRAAAIALREQALSGREPVDPDDSGPGALAPAGLESSPDTPGEATSGDGPQPRDEGAATTDERAATDTKEIAAATLTEERPQAPDPIDEDGIALMPVTWEVLGRLLALARKILELDGHVVIRPVVRSTSWQQSRRAPYGSADTLLNSFTVTDLERVSRDLAATRGRPASQRMQGAPDGRSALERYLDAAVIEDEEADERIDVDADLGRVREALHPERMPAGRWPAAAGHDLALGQQLAVNLALDPEGPAVVAVNGPPGTGKTTMLRDLVAAMVTERARALAELSKPAELFGPRIVAGGDGQVIAHRVHDAVAGRELLLACATNAAAQNVSLELPARGAIAPEWGGRPGYLADFATAALRAAAEDDARARGEDPQPTLLDDGRAGAGWDAPSGGGDPTQAWAFVSARLGRRSYGKAFADAVWWGTPPWAQHQRAVSERVGAGLGAVLSSGTAAEKERVWRAARERFLEALARVDELRAERAAAADRLAPPEELAARVAAARDEAERLQEHVSRQERTRERLAEEVAGNLKEKALASAKRAIARVQSHDRRLADDRARLDEALARLEEEERALALRRAGTEDDTPTSWVVPGERWEDDLSYRELRAPWSDEAWNRARTECFLAALDLHEATLLAAGRKAQQNLRVVFDLLSGRAAGLPHEITRAAWQTLFLVVPVISTTFASMPNLLSGLRAGDLGWLLVDEAGQAEPQQVAGGLWRCQRAMIVGDPLQLDPVTTLPGSLADAIRAHHEVDPAYIGPRASVQRLADRVCPWGGYRGADELWVGVPMNVHRRCEGPIFDLVNAIAYGGRMVNATVDRPAHRALRVPSCWLDVPAGWGDGGAGGGRGADAGDGHWRAAEGARLDALLAHLHREGYDFSELFVVSPFRDVARHLQQRARHPAHRGMTGGTVHTIQGREADAVVLVLGTHERASGARAWASEAPNLLNVAVSRARQRLYVIGDHDVWMREPYFRELGALRRVGPRA
jgi:hypothetical protein